MGHVKKGLGSVALPDIGPHSGQNDINVFSWNHEHFCTSICIFF